MSAEQILQVALDAPLRRLFDYRTPEPAGRCAPQPGKRVRVPFGRRQLVGVVVALTDHTDIPPDKLRAALEVLDEAPVFVARLQHLLAFAAQYYHHPIGEVVAAALPKLARDGATAVEVIACWVSTAAGRDALATGAVSRAPKQCEVLAFIEQQAVERTQLGTPARGSTADELGNAFPTWREAVRALVARGWLTATEYERHGPSTTTPSACLLYTSPSPRD